MATMNLKANGSGLNLRMLSSDLRIASKGIRLRIMVSTS